MATTSPASNPQISGIPPIPRWLTRAEKAAFRRIAEQRNAAGRPVSIAEIDALADLVTLRSRIADTRKIYSYAIAQLKKNPAWRSDQTLALTTSRQIDAQTARAQRMASDLGLSSGSEG
ncbi:hypothetical protein [Mesorhizobium delmotii]|uniref:Uncharacterized protein n=1 Tax=Mesorhizobium delmotii TaxID=1631247 RepID=A0A2P9APQ7_9HYPH|nr:hypothetical protein [Mesorhizobium delmotii]SJM33119.1 hypothetical protein BQ8482_340015 [Mesorhizobium delmotii]